MDCKAKFTIPVDLYLCRGVGTDFELGRQKFFYKETKKFCTIVFLPRGLSLKYWVGSCLPRGPGSLYLCNFCLKFCKSKRVYRGHFSSENRHYCLQRRIWRYFGSVIRKMEKSKLKFMSDIFALPSAAPGQNNKRNMAKFKLDMCLKHIKWAAVSLSDKLMNLAL